MSEQPPVAQAEAAGGESAGAAATSAQDVPAGKNEAADAKSTSQNAGITEVKLPQGWEGLSIKMTGNRCYISEVPKACFSDQSKVADGTIKNQVQGVSEGDEVLTLNGEKLVRVIERISTRGDAWNACSSTSPPHEVGSKTKFDSPPCAACDFIRRRKGLGFDVALQMWLRAVKKDIKFILGVRSGAAAAADKDPGPSLEATPAESSQPVKRMALGALDDCKGPSTVVSMEASAESKDRMERALERLQKLAEQDDKTRDKKHKQAKQKGKGKDKGGGKGKRPTGPYLERTRLTDQLVTGEVTEWKGKFGWIKPHKSVDHPKAGAHKGKLYVHKVDLEWWVKSLTVGSFCRFHVYSDANSLGAEECTELKDSSNDADENAGWEDWKDDDDDGPPGQWGTDDRKRRRT